MSIIGRTFDSANVTAKADGGVNASLMSDGVLWGCEVTATSTGLSITSGELVVKGRVISIDGTTTYAMSPTVASGYGRAIMNVDLTQSAGSQCYLSAEYSTTESFNNLTQQNVNNTGSKYQVEFARVTITSSAVDTLVSQIGQSVIGGDFLSALKLAMYPVGSIYMSASSTNPSSIFGGTWEAWGQGRVPVGVGSNGTSTYANNATGGSESVTLTTSNMPSHNHSFTGSAVTSGATTGSHTHSFSGTTSTNGKHHNKTFTWASMGVGDTVALASGSGGWGSTQMSDFDITNDGNHNHTYSGTTGSGGASHTHSVTASGTVGYSGSGTAVENRQPYITCYMWKRTA